MKSRTKFFLLIIFLFPALALAGVKPLNPNNTAYPDMSDPDCVKSTTDPNCLWLYPLASPKVEPASINLNWEVEGLTNPYCRISCRREDGGSCTGSFSQKDGLFNLSPIWPNDWNYKAKDQVGTLSSNVGDIYQVTCCERRDNPTFFNMCKSLEEGGISKTSYEMKVVEGQRCEVGFESILNSLNSIQYTPITEKDFNSWSGNDDLDFAGFNLDYSKPHRDPVAGGSGDSSDIYKAMEQGQCSAISQIHDYTNFAIDTIRSAKVITDARQPSPLNVAFRRDLNGTVSIKVHQLIALEITEIIANKQYKIKVLDSNASQSTGNPSVYTINCQTINNHYFVNGYYTGVFCEASSSPYGGEMAIGKTNFFSVGNLRAKFNSICPYNDQKKICQERKANMSAWLEKNYPNNVNNTNAGDGLCQGWVDFVLKVTYLGDFVGEDYHPNDGKIIGRDCDANHYPLLGKTALNEINSQQLAGLGRLNQFIQSLTDWFAKTFENFKVKINQLY